MTNSVALREVCDITMGQAPSGESYNTNGDGLPLIAGAGDFGEIYPASKKYTTEATKLCERGDIVLGIRATIGEKVVADGRYCLGRGVAGLRPHIELDGRYLWHWLSHINPLLVSKARGATFLQVNRSDIDELPICLPSLNEQRRIAAILDKADALRTKRREALAQLDRLAQSIFVEMFGDPATNPQGWTSRTLKELGKVSTGGTPPSALEGMFGGEIPFVTPGDLESDKPVKRTVTEAGAQETGTVRAGATLVCCIGATIGKMGCAPSRSAFNQQLNAVEWSTEHVDDLYGLAALRFFKPTIIAWGASTTLPILKKSSFESISIPVPPLALQQKFAKRIQSVHLLGKKMGTDLNASTDLFLSLKSRAFQGRL